MDFSKIKLIVSDMDGTLLNENNDVSERFFEQLYKLRAKNIHFVAASGRQYHSILEKLAPVKDEISIIAENGGILHHDNKTHVLLKLTKNDVERCVKVLRKIKNTYIVLCARQSAYIESENFDFVSCLSQYYSKVESVKDLTRVNNDDFLKIAVFHFESSENHIYPHVKHLNTDYQVTVSGQNWLDISNPLSNKAYALEILHKKMGYTSKDTLAFGDYNNDIEMLKLAQYSVAMKNAHPNVKQIASFITKSNNEQGVETVIDKILNYPT